MDRLGRNFGGHIPSYPRHVRLDAVAMATALIILQLWASEGRTREPILMKFGMRQQVRTAMIVMRSNIKIFKIQNGKRSPCWKYIRNAITRLPIDRLGRNLGGHIPSCPRHVPMMRLPWQRSLPTNGALNILQLWASGGRTREPISIKFGTQQQVRTTMTVT